MGSLLSEWMDAPTDAPADFPESRGRYDASYNVWKNPSFLSSLLGIRSVIIKRYLKCPLKIKKYAYICDAMYQHKKVTALQIYNPDLQKTMGDVMDP